MDEFSWGNFQSFIQDAGKQYLGARIDAKYVKPYDIQALRLQAMGPWGEVYQEGQPGTRQAPAQGGIPGGWVLLGGAALLVVLMLKD